MRGLDYYTRTTFEVQTDRLGSQNAVLGGGRYDGLVKQLGGPDHPAIGFAIGIERLVTLLDEMKEREKDSTELFIAGLGARAEVKALSGESHEAFVDVFEEIPDLQTKTEKITDKFMDICFPILGGDKAGKLKDAILSIEKVDNVKSVIELSQV